MEGLKAKIQGLEQDKSHLEWELAQLESAYQTELVKNSHMWRMRRQRSMVE